MKRVRSVVAGLVTLALVASQLPQLPSSVFWEPAPTVTAQAAQPILSVNITAEGDIRPGGLIRYHVVFTNNTNTVANNVQFGFQDPVAPDRGYGISPYLTFAVAGFPGCNFNATTRLLVCTGPLTIQPGQSHSFIIQFSIAASAPCGTHIYAALDVGATGFAGNWSEIVHDIAVCGNVPDLELEKTAPPTVQAGGTATYTFAVRNVGQAAATDVKLADYNVDNTTGQRTNQLTFPFTSASGASCALHPQLTSVVVCTVGTIAVGETRTFTITFTVPTNPALCDKVVKNIADVAFADQDSSDWDAAETIVRCPSPGVDLSVQKTGPASVTRGTTATMLSYGLIASNAGPAKATGVVVRDPIPAGLTFNAGASSPECILVGSDVKCMNFDLDAGQSRPFTVVFTVPAVDPNTCQQTTIQNVANIFMGAANGLTDTNPNNNQSQTVTTTLLCPTVQQPDLTVQKSGPATVVRGNTFTYSVTAQNIGQGTANGVMIRDVVPANLTYNDGASTPECSLVGNEVQCPVGDLSANQSKSVTIAFTTPAWAECSQVTVTNTATVTATNTESNTSNNTSQTVTTTVTCPQANLGCIDIVKEVFNAQGNIINPVPQFEFKLNGNQSVVNNAAGNARFSNVTPGQHTVSEILPAGWNALSVTPAGGIVQVSAGSTCAAVYFKNQQQQQQNQYPDLTVQKSGPSSVVRGNTLTYSVTAQNIGQANATGVMIRDVVPANLTYNDGASTPECQLVGNEVQCGTYDIAAGNSKTVSIVFDTPVWAVCNPVTVTNIATVTSGNNESNTGNNTSTTVTTTVDCPTQQQPTLTITKTDNRTVATPGETLTYQIVVTNTSNVVANNVTITDTLPSLVTYLSSSDNGSANGQTVTWNNQTIQAGQSRTFTIQARVSNTAANGSVLSNVVSITNGPSATDTTTVQTQTAQTGCINITKLTYNTQGGSLTPVAQFTFQLDGNQTTTNDGNGYATFQNVSVGQHTVTEFLPNTWTQQSVSPSNGVVQVSAGSSCANVTFQNRQVIGGGNTPNLTIFKTDDRTTASPNDILTYRITVTNTSNVNATNVTITDTLSSLLTYISASDNAQVSGQTVTWNNGFVAAGASYTLTLQARVNGSVGNNTTVTNTATIPNGPTSTDTTTIITGNGNANVSVDITDDRDPVEENEEFEYEIRLQNLSSSSQTVTLTQTLDSRTDFIRASNGGSHNNRVVTWSNIFLNANEVRTFTVEVENTDGEDGDSLRSTASAGSSFDEESTRVRDDNDDDDDDDDDEDLRLDITDDRDAARPGEVVTYTISIRNDDNRSRTDDLIVTLDEDLTFISSSDDCEEVGNSDDEVECEDLFLNRNSTEFITIRARVSSAANDGDEVEVRAEIDDEEATETTDIVDNDDGYTPPVDNGQASVFLSKQADRTEANPSSDVYYTVTVRNTSNAIARQVVVTDTYPAQSFTVTDAGSGIAGGGQIVWTIDQLGPNETRVFSYHGRLASHLRHGDSVVNMVRATGQNLSAIPNAVVEVRIVQQLPQTGFGDGTGPLADVRKYLSPFSGATAATPAIVWTTLLLFGLAVGGRVSRRFLI